MRKITAIALSLHLLFASQFVLAENLANPKFQIGGKTTSTVALVVPKNTSDEQLEALVRDFHRAKDENNFSRLIPPTTPNSKRDPYFVVTVYILEDPTLATADNLERFTNSSSTTDFSQKFERSIRAYYYFTRLSGSEEGSLRYSESGRAPKEFKKLF